LGTFMETGQGNPEGTDKTEQVETQLKTQVENVAAPEKEENENGETSATPRKITSGLGEDICDVCFDGETENENDIVFCDSCGMGAHQACYGIQEIPAGEWFCEKCDYLKRHPGEDIKCELCHIRKGAFKPTEEGKWCHACCCVWIPELGFKTPTNVDVVVGINEIDKKRLRLVCQLCNQRGGACIQCVHGACRFAFHISCAKTFGLRMEIRSIEGIGEEDGWDVAYLHYCPKHKDVEFDEKKYVTKRKKELQKKAKENRQRRNSVTATPKTPTPKPTTPKTTPTEKKEKAWPKKKIKKIR